MRKLIIAFAVTGAPLAAQSFPTDNPVLRGIWEEGMTRSQVEPLLQVLLDSIGPRLTGSPSQRAGHDWAVGMYTRWGVPARNEQYGTWRGWRRGVTHVDLIAPRVRSLEATMLAWSPGTNRGRPVEGAVMLLPDLPDSAAYAQWMRGVRGAFVAISFPEPTCRPRDNWERWSSAETADRVFAARQAAAAAWSSPPQRTGRVERTGYNLAGLVGALEAAGVVGILTSRWSLGWGVNKVFGAQAQRVPQLDVSCEDYGLIARLA
ncbi:MAG: peptidase M28, partial [Gemmatimonadales bacterium]